MTVNHELLALEVQQAWLAKVMRLDEADAVKVLELVREQLDRDLNGYRAWLEESEEDAGGDS